METLTSIENTSIHEAENLQEAIELAITGESLVTLSTDWSTEEYLEEVDGLKFTRDSDGGWDVERHVAETVPVPRPLGDYINQLGFRPLHPIVNNYQPGDVMAKHVDIGEYYEPGDSPLLSLTFLYVIDGTKQIRMYLDGEEQEPTDITQEPGMLYIFRATGMVVDGVEYSPLFHEVVSQDAHCRTLTFELAKLVPARFTTSA